MLDAGLNNKSKVEIERGMLIGVQKVEQKTTHVEVQCARKKVMEKEGVLHNR